MLSHERKPSLSGRKLRKSKKELATKFIYKRLLFEIRTRVEDTKSMQRNVARYSEFLNNSQTIRRKGIQKKKKEEEECGTKEYESNPL